MTGSHLLLEQAKLQAAQIGFSAIFNNRLRVAEKEPVLDFAMRVPSTNAEEQFKFLGDLPFLREWVDDRHLSKLRAETITITNRDYATGVRVDRNDIMDDRLGLVMPKINMLADRARQHIADFMVRTLLNGFSPGTNFPETGDGLAYDGQFFFDTDHQDGDGPVQSNFFTTSLSATSYETARVKMLSLLDEQSQPLEIRPMALLVGPSNERTALEIVQAGVIGQAGAGVSNVFAGTAQVMVSQRLVGAFSEFWFLGDLSQPVKPLLWTDREAPRFDAQNTMQSDDAFMRREFKFGTSYRAGYGYGLWQFAHGSDGTT